VDLPRAIEHIRPSVYQVRINLADSPLNTAVLGTAFLVSMDGWLVTAKHVTDGAAEFANVAPGSLHASFAVGNVDSPTMQIRASFVSVPVTVVATSDENDLALLRTPQPIGEGVFMKLGNEGVGIEPGSAVLSIERPKEGESIAISGYPLNEAAMVTTAGSVASSWALDAPPAIGKKMFDRYLGDLTANPGNSGGPVYRLSDGRVIGVCTAGKLTRVIGGEGNQAADLTIVVPAKYVADLLEGQGVQYQTAVSRKRSRSQSAGGTSRPVPKPRQNKRRRPNR